MDLTISITRDVILRFLIRRYVVFARLVRHTVIFGRLWALPSLNRGHFCSALLDIDLLMVGKHLLDFGFQFRLRMLSLFSWTTPLFGGVRRKLHPI